jgi:hypothetical protein
MLLIGDIWCPLKIGQKMGQFFFSKTKVNEADEITTKDKVECKGKRKEDDEKFWDMTEVFKHEEGSILMRN